MQDMNNSSKADILVLGIGNILLRDEGIGVHVIGFLERNYALENVEFLDGGTLGFDLLEIICDRRAVILVDAADAGLAPATVMRFAPQDLLPSQSPSLSAHHIDFEQVLKMAALLHCAPQKVVIFGIQPESIQPGLALTATLQQAVPRIAEQVIQEIRKLQEQINPRSPIFPNHPRSSRRHGEKWGC